MVNPALTYVAGIAFLVLLIGPMLYLMYNYEGVDEEDTPSESVVRGAGPVAAAAESEDDAVEGGADDPTEAAEAGEPADADESAADAADGDETTDSEDADDTEAAEADEA